MDISSKCPFCNSNNTKVFFKLKMPVLLAAASKEELNDDELTNLREYRVNLCFDCGLCFNSDPLSKELTEKLYRNYHYVRPSQGIGTSRFNEIIPLIKKYVKTTDYIYEIGCSDGYLLDKFYDEGYTNIEGIEPSKEYLLAKHKNLIKNDFFTENTILDKKADIIYSTHVFDCCYPSFEFFNTIKNNLKKEGKVIFEVTKLDGFHHLKCVFYTLPFIKKLANMLNMYILDYEKTDAVRVVLGKNGKESILPNTSIDEIWNEANLLEKSYKNLVGKVEDFIKRNKSVYWWGSGISSVVTLSNIRPELLDITKFIFIDGDASRKGLYLPIKELSKYSIDYSANVFKKISNDTPLVIASMYSKEILSTLKEHNIEPSNYIVATL